MNGSACTVTTAPTEREHIAGDYNGTSEVSMRGQYRAWARFMS